MDSANPNVEKYEFYILEKYEIGVLRKDIDGNVV
jgi:hypothetical protein